MTPEQIEKLTDRLRDLFVAARLVADGMKKTPGGDAYTFDGSTNHVDELQNELDQIMYDDFLGGIVYPEEEEASAGAEEDGDGPVQTG